MPALLPTNPDNYAVWQAGRKPDPLEEGELFIHWMQTLNISENQLHKITGLTRPYIQQRRIAVEHGCPALIDAYKAQQITFTQMRTILSGAQHSEAAQRETIAMILARKEQGQKITVDIVKEFAKQAAQSDI